MVVNGAGVVDQRYVNESILFLTRYVLHHLRSTFCPFHFVNYSQTEEVVGGGGISGGGGRGDDGMALDQVSTLD